MLCGKNDDVYLIALPALGREMRADEDLFIDSSNDNYYCHRSS